MSNIIISEDDFLKIIKNSNVERAFSLSVKLTVVFKQRAYEEKLAGIHPHHLAARIKIKAPLHQQM